MITMMLCTMTAFGADPEAERIAEALVQSVREGEWRAVERRYLELVRSHPSGLNGPIHQTAAQGARQRGELLLATQRLLRVRSDAEGYSRAKGDLELIEAQTGLVMISMRTPANPVLKPTNMPFAPDLRKSIEVAAETLQTQGHFVGLLPAGEYTIGTKTVSVQPGFDWHVFTAE